MLWFVTDMSVNKLLTDLPSNFIIFLILWRIFEQLLTDKSVTKLETAWAVSTHTRFSSKNTVILVVLLLLLSSLSFSALPFSLISLLYILIS
jgi:hypothetical protein